MIILNRVSLSLTTGLLVPYTIQMKIGSNYACSPKLADAFLCNALQDADSVPGPSNQLPYNPTIQMPPQEGFVSNAWNKLLAMYEKSKPWLTAVG